MKHFKTTMIKGCKQGGLCLSRVFVAEEFLHFQPLEKLPEWTSSESLCWYSTTLWISMTVSYANSASCCTLKLTFCLLCIWTAFYQGIMWCTVISVNTTPPGGDMKAQHNITEHNHFYFLSLLFEAHSDCLWINELHHVACLYLFVWYNVFFWSSFVILLMGLEVLSSTTGARNIVDVISFLFILATLCIETSR